MTSSGALEAVDRILNRGGSSDDVLRAVVEALHERAFAWAAVAVRADGELRITHEAGDRPDRPALTAPIRWQGRRIGELQAQPRPASAAASDDEEELLDRVAVLVSAHAAAA